VDTDYVTLTRLAASIVIMAYASLLDLKTRKVGNFYWIVLSVIGLILVPVQLAVNEQPMKYALVLVPILAILTDVYWDAGETGRLSRAAPFLKYAVAILSVLVLGCLWIEDDYFQYFLSVPVLMLFIVLLYILDLIRGGADAKALLALSILFPVYPAIETLPLIDPETTSAALVFPFTFAVLVTAAIMVALLPIGFTLWNLMSHEFKFPYGALGYEADVDKLKGRHVWLMENMVDGSLQLHTRPRRDEDLDKEIELLKSAGVSRVWITPKVPFLIPLTAGLIFTAIVGNILFLIFGF